MSSLAGKTLIDHLFARLDALYPHRWRAAFPSDESIANWRQTWAEALAEKKITFAEIKQGLNACQAHLTWPPSCAEFLKACRPELDPEASYREAILQLRMRETHEDIWSHPAVYWAAIEFGQFELTRSSWDKISTRWTKILQKNSANFSLPPVPSHRIALPSPKPVLGEEAKQKIAEIRKMMAEKRNPIGVG